MQVGTPVEIKPGISPDVFGNGGVLSRDEYGLQEYQTQAANIEKIGYDGNEDLPYGTVMVCHGNKCSIYSINHLREYNPEENYNSNITNDPMNGGRRKRMTKKKRGTKKYKKYKKSKKSKKSKK